MNKKILAAAVLAAMSGVAMADDNVTLYGIVDGGLTYTNKSPTTVVGGVQQYGTLVGYQSNGEAPSIFGFKGSEDLGGGLKAGFDLEGHFLSGNGLGNEWGGLFGRQANVSLSSSAGSATLGAQYSPAVLAYAATDPRGLKESFSGLMTWAFTQYGLQTGTTSASALTSATANQNTQLDIFIKQALTLSTKIEDVSVSLAYAFGGVSGSTQANRVIALGVVYTGPVTISASYQTENGATSAASGTANEKYSIGAGYTWTDFTFKANYLSNKQKDPLNGNELGNYKVFGVGADYKAAANDTITLAFYDGKNDGNAYSGTTLVGVSNDTARTFILSNDYSLSKRTTLYGLVAEVNAGSNASYGSSAYNGDNFGAVPAQGQTSFAFQLGIKHTF